MDSNEQFNIVENVINKAINGNSPSMTEEERKKSQEKFMEDTGHEVEFIEPDDAFDFKCQQCGRCCMGRQDIIMSPIDVFHIAQATNKTTEQVCNDYLALNIGPQSGLPVFCLKEENGKCPFLKMDITDGFKYKCSIDKYKPGACRNHPIGIIMGFASKNAEPSPDMEYTEDYIIVEQCNNSRGHNHMNRVSDWVSNTLTTDKERRMAHLLQIGPCSIINLVKFYTIVLNTVIFTTGIALRDSIVDGQEMLKPEERDLYLHSFIDECGYGSKTLTDALNIYTDACLGTMERLMSAMYFNYDTSKDFAKQAEQNWYTLKQQLESIKDLHEILYKFVSKGIGINDEAIYNNLGPEINVFQTIIKLSDMIESKKEEFNNAIKS